MIRRYVVGLLVLFLGFALAQAPKAIGTLYVRDMSGSLNMVCTASLIDGGDLGRESGTPLLITAAHCVNDALSQDQETEEWRSGMDYFFTFDERSYYEVVLDRVGISGAGYDVALARFVSETVDLGGVRPIKIRSWDDVEVGDDIVAWSNPMGLGLQRFAGYITMLSLDRPVTSGAQINWRKNAVAMIPSAGGSSGSLILDQFGFAIGVLVGVVQPRSGSSFTVFVPIWKVQEFITVDSAGRDIVY